MNSTPVLDVRAPGPTAGAERMPCVLILDDQEAIASLLKDLVRLLDFDSSSECDPKRALERLREEDFDVIISDYRMPEMNGQEFYRAAVQAQPELAPRFIFLTGDTLSDETNQFLKATGAPFLNKPFQLAKIEKAIRKVLKDGALAR